MGLSAVVRGRTACLKFGGGSCDATSLARAAEQPNSRLIGNRTDLLTTDQKAFCGVDILPTRNAMITATKSSNDLSCGFLRLP